MRTRITTSGLSQAGELFHAVPVAADVSMTRVLNFMAQSTAQRARNLIRNSPASGHVYEINGVTHQASAPGEPPASFSGALIDSIRYTRITTNPESGADAGSSLGYAKTLEYGGLARFQGETVYIEPRPFLQPAFEEAYAAGIRRFAPEYEAELGRL